MKKYSKLVYLFALVAAVATTACSDDFGSNEIPQEELYTRAFIKEFGVFDANHTWCAATPTQITINPQSLLSDVKVYSKTDDKYYYVAHYTDVYKTTTITFDAPRGTTDLKIIADGTTYYAQAGTTLTVSSNRSSRTIYPVAVTDDVDGDGVGDGILVTATTSTLVLDNADILSYSTTLPESKNNLGKVTQNFFFTSNGEFTIYPVFWHTSHQNTIGLYTKSLNADGVTYTITKYPIYKNDQASDALQMKLEGWWAFTVDECKAIVNADFTDSDYDWNELEAGLLSSFNNRTSGRLFYINWTHVEANSIITIELPGEWSVTDVTTENAINYVGNDQNTTIDPSTSIRVKFSSDWINAEHPKWKGDEKISYPTETKYQWTTNWQSKGIYIKVKDNLEFGMYLENTDDNYIYYSEAEFNELTWDSSTNSNIHLCHAGTYLYASSLCLSSMTYDTRVLAFEDWYGKNDSTEPDLNDMIFFIRSSDVTLIPSVPNLDSDPTPYEWLICAEDLGTTDDFDFNDMVVKVKKDINGSVNGTYSKMYFTAMAAGGTIPLQLYFNYDQIYTSNASLVSSITEDGLMYPDGHSDKTKFHQWFGSNGIADGVMINTGATGGQDGVKGRTCTLYIKGDFTLNTKQVTLDATSSANNTLENFYILVLNDATTGDSQVIQPTSKSAGTGIAPQMFVTRYSWSNNGNDIYFQWPNERTNIEAAYNDTNNSFMKWVQADLATTSEWFKYPTQGVCLPSTYWGGEQTEN